MYKYGKKIREIREDRDETREYLAKKIDASAKQIERWEKGTSEMGITKLEKICNHYKVSANYILETAETHDRTKEEILERSKQKKNQIDKDIVFDILLWAEEQGHISGDIYLIIQNINTYQED